ncbi:MAG: Integral membrane protein CcmA involved in cell shape determination [Bacteroidetes bacterium HLUCCA01]|nr:MAG: Integral membrane protein CcmA involved in cell shape determination [Bacteroidetes bacterium HLUCCA01]
MFSSKSNAAMQDNTAAPAINMISDGTVITGSLETKKDFRISGELNGSLKVDGKCVITSAAVINGDITATEADIAGKVEGEVTVSGKLILRKTSQILGDIQTKTLLVEEGARFEGACHMGDGPVRKKSGSHGQDHAFAMKKAVNE